MGYFFYFSNYFFVKMYSISNSEYEMIRKTIKSRAFKINHWEQSTIFDDEFGIFTFLSRKCFRATYILTFLVHH